MSDPIERIRKTLAAGPTPEPWTDDTAEHDTPYQDIRIKGKDGVICSVWIDDAPVPDYNSVQKANAAFITACSPDTIRALLDRLDTAERELERERMRLAACGVVAGANTPESAANARQMHPDYQSGSCDAVARAVDREMALRAENERLREDAERLDSGCIRLVDRDEFGESVATVYSQVDLRAAIDAARRGK